MVSGLLTKKREEKSVCFVTPKNTNTKGTHEAEEKEVMDKYVPFLPDKMEVDFVHAVYCSSICVDETIISNII